MFTFSSNADHEMWNIAYYIFSFVFNHKLVNEFKLISNRFVSLGWVTDYMEYNVTKSQDSNDSDEDMDVMEDETSETRTAREKT